MTLALADEPAFFVHRSCLPSNRAAATFLPKYNVVQFFCCNRAFALPAKLKRGCVLVMDDPHILGTHHRLNFGQPECVYDVLYEGVEYRCDDHQLRLLYDGVPLDELDLLRIDPRLEDGEVDDD